MPKLSFSDMRVAVAGIALAAASSIGLLAAAPASAAAPTVPSGFSITMFAAAPSGSSIPDDITRLDGHLFVGYQNGVGPNGEPGPSGTSSTLVQYNDDGTIANQWQLTGKIDGLGADAANHRVLATVNEDSNSSLYTITPVRAGGRAGRSLRLLAEPEPGERLWPAAHRRRHRLGDGDAQRHDPDRRLEPAVAGGEPRDDRRRADHGDLHRDADTAREPVADRHRDPHAELPR